MSERQEPGQNGRSERDRRPLHSIRDDAPLADPTEDTLGRAPFAARVARVIAERSDEASIVIGLYGPWGDGKTTVLNFIRSSLNADDRLLVVAFNPWLVGDTASLLPVFFEVVAKELGVRLGGRRRVIADRFRKVGQAVSALSLDLAPLGLDPSTGTAALAEILAPSSLEQLREEFEEALRQADKRVVVLVDDLDRLDDQEIREIFRLIRLVAPFDRMSYVVACDDRAVARALASAQGGDESTGHDFLEKIVQVPLHIPPASPDALFRWIGRGLTDLLDGTSVQLTDTEASEIGQRLSGGITPGLRTPRAVKRYLNAVAFAEPMLRGDANFSDLVAIEGIRVAYPALYAALREHQDWFVPHRTFFANRDEEQKAALERLTSVLGRLPQADRDPARMLVLELFPSFRGPAGSVGVDELFRERRVAHPDYYERYFTYAVSDGGLSDSEMAALFADPDTFGDAFFALLRSRGSAFAIALARKLDVHRPELAPAIREMLLALLPKFGALLREDSRSSLALFSRSTTDVVADVIVRMVEQVEAAQRFEVAEAALDEAEPIGFAAELYGAFGRRLPDREKPMFESARADRLARRVAARVGGALGDEPIWESEPLWVPLLFLAERYGQRSAVRRAVGRWLVSDPSRVTRLLADVAGVAHQLSPRTAIAQNDLDRGKYAGLGKIARLSDLRRAVRLIAPGRRPTVFPDASESREPSLALIDQFILCDRAARADARAARTAQSPVD